MNKKKGVSGKFNQMGRRIDLTRNNILCFIFGGQSTNTR